MSHTAILMGGGGMSKSKKSTDNNRNRVGVTVEMGRPDRLVNTNPAGFRVRAKLRVIIFSNVICRFCG
jgi:hypothetical protein